MKLVIQIPCLNEETTLPLVLETIPKKISGIDEILVVVIDDGSTDKTVAVAKAHGVKHFVRHPARRGLGRSFQDGMYKALELGADILVNTDGDNQYPQKSIPALIRPIIDGAADIVVADRQTNKIAHFSPFKKLLQRIGSTIVNMAASTNVPDAASGFRAYSREALYKLNPTTSFSYCMETIIQAGNKGLSIASIPITVNPKTRESRLFKSNGEHIYKSASAIVRAFIMYRPYVLFISIGSALLIAGIVPFARYGYFFLKHEHGNHLQSLLLGSILLIGSVLSFVLGVIADLVRVNRILAEQDLEINKHIRFGN
jgi:glycosyltransferase involved in cell wall biosynthesis